MQKKIVSLILFLALVCSLLLSAQAAGNRANGKNPRVSGKKPDVTQISSLKKEMSLAQKKLSSDLLQATDEKFLPKGTTKKQILNRMRGQKQLKEMAAKTNGLTTAAAKTSVFVYVQMAEGADFDILKPYVTEIKNTDSKNKLAACWVALENLNALAALEGVKNVRTVTAPMVKTGTVTSQGDSVLRANLARAANGVTGKGVKIGVISDGVDHRASAMASGNLPSGLTVLSNAVGGDEGTAMLEIIYDLAPGAQLYFHDCGNNVIAFNQAMDDLAAAGCDIICDDIGWLAEPFFEDGIVASHMKAIADKNKVLFVSAAGNAADAHYQGTFTDAGAGFNDFSGGTDASRKNLYVDIPYGAAVIVVLQWNEPFGKAYTDFDLMMDDTDTSAIIGFGTEVQDGNDDPIEGFYYENDTGKTVHAYIDVFTNAVPKTAKTLEVYIYCYGNSEKKYPLVYANNLTQADSIYGHPAVPGVVACGAVCADSINDIEYFSSQGPVTTLTGTRNKPDVCGVDGVAVTGAGGFPNPFYGTSAAAPHVAAIAALLKSKFPYASPADIRSVLYNNTIDLGASGFDSVFGYGRVDALAAVSKYAGVAFTNTKKDIKYYGNSGAISIAASGGNSGNYQYSINGGASWQSSGEFSGLKAGTYSVGVRDPNVAFNKKFTSVTITQPDYRGKYAAARLPSKILKGTAIKVTPVSLKGYTQSAVSYETSNKSIAYADEKGNVTFLKTGKVKLTVTTVYKKTVSGRVTTKTTKITKMITVQQPVTAIQMNKTSVSLMLNKTYRLKATVSPSSAANRKVTWKSGNTKIATVSSSGLVRAKKKGTVTITCTAQDGSKVYTQCTVTVS